MRQVWLWVLLGAAAVMPACGQKGPLVLPDSHPRRARGAGSASTPAPPSTPAATAASTPTSTPAPQATPAQGAAATQPDEARPDAPKP